MKYVERASQADKVKMAKKPAESRAPHESRLAGEKGLEKIILYYKFVEVKDPTTAMHWQRELCTRLELKGRIIVSEHGINGTLGGKFENVKAYVKAMNAHPTFKGIDYKWSDGSADDFPRLSVKVRKELVTLNPDENFDPFNRGKALKPKQWKEFIKKNPGVTILDGRNDFESEIGKFKGAITPKIKVFRDIKKHVAKLPKDKPVLTYCTGDIRCEYLSAFMLSKGFKDVYHLDGGIVKYGQQIGDDELWEGKCFVFDKRLNIAFSDKAKDIGKCVHCGQNTSRYIDCGEPSCNRLVLVCETDNQKTFCKDHQPSVSRV